MSKKDCRTNAHNIWDGVLAVNATPSNLRNLAVLVSPSSRRANFSNILASLLVNFTVSINEQQQGQVFIQTVLPLVQTFDYDDQDSMTLVVRASDPGGGTVSWSFEKGGTFTEQDEDPVTHVVDPLTHEYTRPGRYEVTLRVVRNGKLYDYTATVSVSREHDLEPPLFAWPVLQVQGIEEGEDGPLVLIGESTQTLDSAPVDAVWNLNRSATVGGSEALFKLAVGSYTLTYSASRRLTARFFGTQCYNADESLMMEGLKLTTNRTWDDDTGAETTDPNVLTDHIFQVESESPLTYGNAPISPADRWTLQVAEVEGQAVPLTENGFLLTVDANDELDLDFGDISDLLLVLEYETV